MTVENREISENYGDSAGTNIQEDKSVNSIGKAKDIQQDLTAFERAFTTIFVWWDTGQGGGEWRIHERYRSLFACLTPRQIKSFLRERLLAATGAVEDGPAATMLSTLFHDVWKVRRDEKALFIALAHAAEAALSRQESGELGGTEAEIFYLQLRALAGRSSILDEEAVRACWPRKSEERALLLHLLKTAYDEEEQGGRKAPEQKSFAAWVREQLGARPAGVSAAEQMSSFQDMVLERHRSGDKSALQVVSDYADHFLEHHLPFLDASSAVSLSNLAVLIDDAPGAEVQCDRLFRAAVKLAQPGSRISFFYVEFLLDTLADAGRRERMIPAPYDDEAAVVAHAQSILDSIGDYVLEPKDRFYRDILKHRLTVHVDDDLTARMKGVWNFVKEHASLLADGSSDPSSRLNSMLDAVIGKKDMPFRLKEMLQGIIWAVQKLAEPSAWAMAIQIANDLVGESDANTLEEKLGLRMNAALLCNEKLLMAGENDRIAAIWSQSGSLLAQRVGKPAGQRVALAFLACFAYGGGPRFESRSHGSWNRLFGKTDVRPGDWHALLGPEQKTLIETIAEDKYSGERMRALTQAVFAPEYWPSVDNPETLADELGWNKEALSWAEGKTFGQAVEELQAAANSKKEPTK